MSKEDGSSPVVEGAPGTATTSPLPDAARAWSYGWPVGLVLKGPLSWALSGLIAVQLATWLPQYLTWPYWPDHDVFATLARAWDRGVLPYRDMGGNNFPGTIYVFWILGKTVGWGGTLPFYAFDAGLLVMFGGLTLAWSRFRLGSSLPGLIASLTFLSTYFGFDYAIAAQRDWHGPCFAVMGLLLLETLPGKAGRFLSALAFAVAFTIRPQTVLFLPGFVMALDESARRPGESLGRSARAVVAWGVSCAVLILLAFLPLILAGVLGDFVRSIRMIGYGSAYNRVTVSSFVRTWLIQLEPVRLSIVPLAMLILAPAVGYPARRLALTWFLVLLGVSLYRPLSPSTHLYLSIPLILSWSMSLAVLAYLALEARPSSPTFQALALVVVLAWGTTFRPEFCAIRPSLRALREKHWGEMPSLPPAGYSNRQVSTGAFYPWDAYRDVVAYLRRKTTPDTRVANALTGDLALNGPIDRLSAFPAEALTWLRWVKPGDAAKFAEALRRHVNSVVVWDPSSDRAGTTELVDQVIRDEYEPEAKFGVIEVWRRKGRHHPASGSRSPG